MNSDDDVRQKTGSTHGMTDETEPAVTDQLTACAQRNPNRCDECGDLLKTQQDNVRNVRWGFWNATEQDFERDPHNEWYCPECWRENFGRDAAAHYEITDADRFWDILDAADGELVADLRPVFVGGRVWIRIRNGELEGMRVRTQVHKSPKVVSFDTVRIDIDQEWFNTTFEDVDESDDGPPTIALLKPADETPFADYREVHETQTTLSEAAQ